MASENKKLKRPLLYLRAILAFVLVAAILGGVYWLCYRSFLPSATWVTPGRHDAFVYDGDTYRLVGTIGKRGLTLKKYPIGESVGRVKDDGTPVVTEAPTLPPDAEPGETVKLTPPDGDPTLARDHAYVLYTVKDKENMLLMLETDGVYRLYYRESAAYVTPGDLAALAFDGKTYLLVGTLGSDGLLHDDFETETLLGLIRDDTLPPETASADFILHTVKAHANLLIVEGPDDVEYLYYREGSKKPIE